MIAWPAIKPALLSLFSSLAMPPVDGALPFAAQWRERARWETDPAYRCDLFLNVTTTAGIGSDEVRVVETRDEDGNVVSRQEAVYGHRRIILRIEAHALDDADDASAMDLIDRCRTRLNRRSSVAALQAVKLSVVSMGPALDTTYGEGERRKPRATCDIVLLGVAYDIDDTPGAGNWIEKVLLTGYLTGEDGVVRPIAPYDIDQKLPDDDQVFHRSLTLTIPALSGGDEVVELDFAEAKAGDGVIVNAELPAGVALACSWATAGHVQVALAGTYAGGDIEADVYVLRSRDLTPP